MGQITVPFTILHEGPGIQASWAAESGYAATVRFRVAWADLEVFLAELTGTARLVVPTGGTKPQVIMQLPYEFPGIPGAYCRSISSIRPFGRPAILTWLPAGKWLAAKEAIVEANFSYFPVQGQQNNQGDPQEDASGKPFTTTSVQLAADVITIPEFTLQFPDGTPNNTPFPYILPTATITMKRLMLPYIPLLEMFSVLGYVNGGPMQLGNKGCAPGTVLFCGGSSEWTLNTDGSVLQNVDYTFNYRGKPWNQAINPKNGQWQTVADSGGNQPYLIDPTNFDSLP